MIDLTDSRPSTSEEVLMQGKRILVIAGSSMYLPYCKKVHLMSVSQASLRVCWKLNCNVAMDDFVKHYQTGINRPVNQRHSTCCV